MPWVPPGLHEGVGRVVVLVVVVGSEKELLCGKSSRCHCTCRPKQCHWSPQFAFYLFMSDTEIWIHGAGECRRGGGDPNQAGIKPPQILSCSTNISVNIQDLVVFGYKGTIVWKKKQDRKWNLEIAILAHSVLVLWNKHFAVHVFEGAVWKKMATSLIHGTSREPLYHTLAHMQFNCVFPWYYFKVHSSD